MANDSKNLRDNYSTEAFTVYRCKRNFEIHGEFCLPCFGD
jgi:hypothetical protein